MQATLEWLKSSGQGFVLCAAIAIWLLVAAPILWRVARGRTRRSLSFWKFWALLLLALVGSSSAFCFALSGAHTRLLALFLGFSCAGISLVLAVRPSHWAARESRSFVAGTLIAACALSGCSSTERKTARWQHFPGTRLAFAVPRGRISFRGRASLRWRHLQARWSSSASFEATLWKKRTRAEDTPSSHPGSRSLPATLLGGASSLTVETAPSVTARSAANGSCRARTAPSISAKLATSSDRRARPSTLLCYHHGRKQAVGG